MNSGAKNLLLLEFPNPIKKVRFSPGNRDSEEMCSDMIHDGTNYMVEEVGLIKSPKGP